MSRFQPSVTTQSFREHYRPASRRVPVWLQRVWYWL